jgi:hypothetical protein
MPFGAFFFLACRAVFPVFRRRYSQVANAPTVLEGFDFGIRTQIAHDDNFIDASRHVPAL